MKKFLLLFVPFIMQTLSVPGADTLQIKNADVTINAVRLMIPVKVDGKLTEEVWNFGVGFENFIQRDPVEGIEPTEKTILRIAYDENALYVGARMYDSSPDSITARLSRRDEWVNSDHITVYLDPYYDKRSGYFFTLNAAGTLIDGVLFNDSWDDETWDGVWDGKVNRDNYGWTAEMRIPFSQMRFNENSINIWGINFRRHIARKSEVDFLVFIPRNESGFVSHFADLTGMEHISVGGQMELVPYMTIRAEYIQNEYGDPFNDGSSYVPGQGVDLKMGIGSNLNLNATINPDFGQVEIDPAVINLSDVETFFVEKRPFFTEGSTIFNFGYGGANNYWGFNWASPDFFYSRRVGSQPQGSVPDVDYEEYPTGTDILGAAKLTGKIGSTWNFGTIQSVTKREFAQIQTDGNISNYEVEPLAYYGVVRTQKEFNEGNQGLGFISTLALRDFEDRRLEDEFNRQAVSFGIDGWTFLDSSSTWVLAGWTGMSYVGGSAQQMTELQRSSQHYFQRPDASHVSVDTTASSLTGFAGRFHLNKQKGNFFVNTAFGFITPGFDVNDLGFMWRTDKINWHVGAGYEWTDPSDFYRYLSLGAAVFRNNDYDENIISQGIFHFGYLEFLNYYFIDWAYSYYPESMNNNRTRGGPLMLSPKSFFARVLMGTDNRKDWVINLSGSTWQDNFGKFLSAGIEIEFRPLLNISLSISPNYEWNFEHSQYIDTYDDILAVHTFGKRYVFGELNQKTFSANIRLNWTLSPKLSLQLFVQPLISSGEYLKYKELAAPRTYDYNVYGEGNSSFDEENYIADPDGDGPAPEIDVGNNNFNFISLRGNAVIRWEYFPGSVFYFVWTQSRSIDEENGKFNFDHSFSKMLSIQPDNIFMLKFTYWFNL
jgi:hypothetical protein